MSSHAVPPSRPDTTPRPGAGPAPSGGVLTPQSLRTAWQAYFASKGHTAYPSASLVPTNDPTLLFTGAGMNQFKDMFLGKGSHPFRRASTVQKCLRAGDIDNVGRTLRHFTFFEMLGNFSFDDYFEDEAIDWAHEFTRDVLRVPLDRLVVTVYETDDVAHAAWRRVGVPAERIHRFGAKDNFWPANAPDDGPNGPCGPCTEMYFDARPSEPLPKPGIAELDSERFLEFWNLVFPQFDRRGKGDLAPLGRRNVDTGAGLERCLAVAAGHVEPFHTPVVLPIVERAAALVGVAYEPRGANAQRLRRIADHARAAVFCVADGVRPSNEGRGYVLRRILRRAIRDGILLRLDEPFLDALVPAVVGAMGDGYPDLAAGERELRAVLRQEEEQFRDTYTKGLRFLEQEVAGLGTARVVAGEVAFRLYDTYGFPLDLAEQILSERGLSVDRAGYDRELEAQRERARAASKMAGDVFATGPLGEVKASGARPTAFLGYGGPVLDVGVRDRGASTSEAKASTGSRSDGCESEATVVGLVRGDASVPAAGPGEEVLVVLDATPFYPEGGGQVGDAGTLATVAAGGSSSPTARATVHDTQAREGYTLHRATVDEGQLRVGARVRATVDRARRDATRRNHTATHLLHEALKRVLGSHVEQQGSLVAPDRLRFDFRHPKPLATEELRRIEDLVNGWVLENEAVDTRLMATDAAKASGAVALFGENYGDEVRVVAVGAVSRELCGGTHVRRAGDIGSFRVVSEGSVAAGVRRVEAVTGLGAVAAAAGDRERLRDLSLALKAAPDEIGARVAALQEEVRALRRDAERRAAEASARAAGSLAERAETVEGLRLLAVEATGVDGKALRGAWDAARRAGVDVAVLVGDAPSGAPDKAPILAAATPDAVAKGVDAADLLRVAGSVLGGGGGGKPELAQGQGLSRAKIAAALDAVRARLRATRAKA